MDELERIRREYARRANDSRYRDWYAPTNRAHQFSLREREEVLQKLLNTHPALTRPGERCWMSAAASATN